MAAVFLSPCVEAEFVSSFGFNRRSLSRLLGARKSEERLHREGEKSISVKLSLFVVIEATLDSPAKRKHELTVF